eukprot:TRINITY_DN721_c0_g1_i2.p1 TRINITY_DN721_c0_g1~~TRINITY_DN721_c0_g1_i2.p1  ORF type:complete len:353 (+),score=129.72 TRINITY_DN721_c0_g1_i2:128-1186(+)
MRRTQKNKATEHHLGTLKAKLAKLRAQLLDPGKAGPSHGAEGFEVQKFGDARVAMIGFPSVGKSTILSELTDTESQSAGYEFTTLTCIPGNIDYKGATIQLLDMPGIIEGAAQGRGKGRQVVAAARTADLILMMMDARKGDLERRLLEKELKEVGLRLNEKPADIYFRQKTGGGVAFSSTVNLTQISERLVKSILHEYKIFNAEVVFREDANVDQFIDVLESRSRSYIPCVYAYNKIDQITIDEVDLLARLPHAIVISCNMKLNLDRLLDKIWDYLDLIRIYTKKRGEPPNFDEPLIVRSNATVQSVCRSIHRDFELGLKYAAVWGKSAKHTPQRCGLSHVLEDEDVIELVI